MLDFVSFERPWYLLLLLAVPLFWMRAGGFRRFAGVRWALAAASRTAVVGTLILALAGIQWVQRDDGCSVVFLIDRSKSIASEDLDRVVAFVNSQIRHHHREQRGDRVGVISFARDAAVDAPPVNYGLRLSERFETDLVREETDLAAALRLAHSVMSNRGARRIVILSDGNVTRGDAIAASTRIADSGIGIDVVAINGIASAEVAVEKVSISSAIRKDAPFDIRVVVSKRADGDEDGEPVTGELTVHRQGLGDAQLVSRQRIELDNKLNLFTLRDQLPDPGFYTYQATIVVDEPHADAHRENNVARGFAHIAGAGRVLVISDVFAEEGASTIAETLVKANLEVTRIPASETPATLAELQAFDLVILDDVPYSNGDGPGSVRYFTDAQLGALVENTHQLGCGLMMVGGPNSYGTGGWTSTAVEKAMPVDFQIRNRKVEAVGALMLVIDSSGSMQGEKLQLAKAAALAATRALSPRDSIGVVSFDSEAEEIVPLQEVRDGEHVPRLISRLAAGGGTFLAPAMQTAFRRLASSDAAVKHMIILSDGQTQRGEDLNLVPEMRKAGITVSTVAIGSEADRNLMGAIASRGGGKFYQLVSPRAVPQIFMREARRVSRPLIYENESGIAVDVMASHESLAGIAASPPPIGGYVMTTPKENALVQMLLAAEEPAGQVNPILATWQYGAGRSVALTTDAGDRWATQWTDWSQRDKMLVQVARWAMRPTSTSDSITALAEVVDDQIVVTVNAMDEQTRYIDHLTPRVAVVGPDLERASFSLHQTGPGRYIGSIPAADQGVYMMSVSAGAGMENVRLGLEISGSDEFRPQANRLTLLEDLSRRVPSEGTEGQLIPLPDREESEASAPAFDAFRGGLRIAADFLPAWHILVFAGAVLFVLDVLNRRLAGRGTQLQRLLSREEPARRRPELASALAGTSRPGFASTLAPDADTTSPEPDDYFGRLKQAKQRARPT